MLRKASKKWDSCAGEALLVAAGGGVTDTVGRLYDYTHNPDAVQNLCGLVGFADRALGERVTRTIQETIAPLGDYPYDGVRARAATRAFSRACAGAPGGGACAGADACMPALAVARSRRQQRDARHGDPWERAP